MSDNRILQPSAITMVPSVSDVFLTLPEVTTNAPPDLCPSGTKYLTRTSGCSVIWSAMYAKRSLIACCSCSSSSGRLSVFSNGIIIPHQGCKRSKLCSPIVHGHPLTSRGNMVRKVYNVIVAVHALCLPTCWLRSWAVAPSCKLIAFSTAFLPNCFLILNRASWSRRSLASSASSIAFCFSWRLHDLNRCSVLRQKRNGELFYALQGGSREQNLRPIKNLCLCSNA